MQHEFIFEIGTEEIPAGYIAPAISQLEKNLAELLTSLNLSWEGIHGMATPRRLAVCVDRLADHQPDRQEEVLGPPKKAGFDANGAPTKAAAGFARSRGVSVDEIRIAKTPKGEYLMVVVEEKGRRTLDLLADRLPELIKSISFPKSMRWGSGLLHFARPIQWLLALYGGERVPVQLDTLASGNTTRGHRFMSSGTHEITSFAQYRELLREKQVLVDPEERKQTVREEIARAAAEAGGRILPDEELVETVSNLVEKPFAVCGSFEERFLELPREVLITSMREHQKYFAVTDTNDNLLPFFIAVNNTHVRDAGMAVEGHQRVIRARLEDALFFFKEDQARPLAERVNDLQGVIFQAKLGTLREKTERITSLAGHLAEIVAPEQAETARRAAFLAKSDLLTSMVNEFPSLQGVIGKDYARLNGEPGEVARAIQEHYLPLRAGGVVPSGIAGSLVGMADRLDTIAGCFGIGQTPTGTADPFGLRRQSLGLLQIITARKFSLSLPDLVGKALDLYGDKLTEERSAAKKNILEFIKGRFVNELTAQGIPAETVEAVTSVRFEDVVDCRARINALAAISGQESFSLLAGSFKRVKNIIKDHNDEAVDPALFAEAAEKNLHDRLLAVREEVRPLLQSQSKDYEKAMSVILKMKDPVDLFFDQVMVMVEEEPIRKNRLALLTAISHLFLQIGDFSKMYALG
jgi:glycyl-tRNA synthetase beta chain